MTTTLCPVSETQHVFNMQELWDPGLTWGHLWDGATRLASLPHRGQQPCIPDVAASKSPGVKIPGC